MEVMIPSPAADFNFDSACTTPFVSAPSSPQRFGNFFFSAPTSPTRAASFYRDLNSLSGSGSVHSTVPFNWEEKPGVPKTAKDANYGNDFEFEFSGQPERNSVSADELFDGGKIKPLKPPPRLQLSENGLPDSPRSPRSPTAARMFKEALSPRRKKSDFDPFAAAIEQTRRQNSNLEQPAERGRERTYKSSASTVRHKGTRSLSPFRVSDIFESEINNQQSSSSSTSTTDAKDSSSSSSSSSSSLNSAWKAYKKWRLKDFLLFRSASEGRATSKETLRKYSMVKKSAAAEEVKNSSFRSTDSGGSVSSSMRRKGPVSAHELHYTAKRAVSEEMRKKTFLPYNHGLLGCLGFNPAVNGIAGGLAPLPRE